MGKLGTNRPPGSPPKRWREKKKKKKKKILYGIIGAGQA
jgi:hypothetical protein